MNDKPNWPRGLTDEVAVIDIEIAELERLYGLSFLDDFDDLDFFRYYIFEIQGRSYALMRYENAPMPGVTLIIEKTSDKNVHLRIFEALEALQLKNRRLLWEKM